MPHLRTAPPPVRVLVVEDDPVLNDQLAQLMACAGYLVDRCFCGESGLELASRHEHQLILLDVMLPQRDGFSLLGILRQTSNVPVIMVTAKGAEEERIMGLSQGADDYLTKPFNTTELLLRVEALLRRSLPEKAHGHGTSCSLDGLLLDRIAQQARAHGKDMGLTPIEFRLLWILLQNRGEILSKAYLSRTVLKRSLGRHDRSLDMHLSRVRRKLKQTGWPETRLQTVHGKGYCLT